MTKYKSEILIQNQLEIMQFLCDYCKKEFILPTDTIHMRLLDKSLE